MTACGGAPDPAVLRLRGRHPSETARRVEGGGGRTVPESARPNLISPVPITWTASTSCRNSSAAKLNHRKHVGQNPASPLDESLLEQVVAELGMASFEKTSGFEKGAHVAQHLRATAQHDAIAVGRKIR